MKKQILSVSIIASLIVGLTGCTGGSGGGNLSTPVKERKQNVDAKVMKNLDKNAGKEFDSKLSSPKYKNVKTLSLGELKKHNLKLYNLIQPLALEAQKMYKQRALPEDILKNGAQWLIGDVNQLEITLASTGKNFNGRFSPFNNLLILNYNNKTDDNLAKFLIAHEFAHAISLHVSEDETSKARVKEGAGDAAGLALDIALNEAYLKLNQTSPQITKLLNGQAAKVLNVLFTKDDVLTEQTVLKNRASGMLAQLAVKAGQKDKLRLLGIGLEIPVETKLALKSLIKSGLDTTGALETLKGGVDFASANALAITGHPKEQEMEADSIALELTNRIGLNTLETACNRFAGNKEAGVFDAHPSYKDRRANLNCKN